MVRSMKKLVIFACLIVFVGAGFAVTNEEADKMKSAAPQKAIKCDEKFVGVVTKWQISGFYKANKGSLYEKVFDPEFDMNPDVEWKTVYAGENGGVDILKIVTVHRV
jgi:hypothetical protein